MSVTAIIQARMGSTRLPGKSMMLLAGKPVVMHLVDRARAASSVDRVIVATTTAPLDDPLEKALTNSDVAVFRGSEADVLARYVGAAQTFIPAEEQPDAVIVRLTADDPLKDPAIINMTIRAYLEARENCDYVCNNQPAWLPEGQDTEVMSLASLLIANRQARDPYDREHVTPYIYREPGRFRCQSVSGTPDLSWHRWTLDTPADMAFLERVLAVFPDNPMPSMSEVLEFLSLHPEVTTINSDVARSALYIKQADI